MATGASGRWLRLLAISCAALSLRAEAGQPFSHDGWARVLRTAVNAVGEVDYGALKQDARALDAYVAMLAEASPVNRPELFPSKAHELAYYINAYNALVTKGVAKAYPTQSVRDLGMLFGFFRREEYVLGGKKISLQTLEHDIIRKQYGDPRIHFAIVCASLSCPKLAAEPYVAARLDAQLDAAARQFVNERRNALVANGAVTLSEIFKWYAGDFQKQAPTVLEYLKKYAAPELRRALDGKLRVKYFDYDWAINDPGSRARAKSVYERELASGVPVSGGPRL
jgi:hypothetical protein